MLNDKSRIEMITGVTTSQAYEFVGNYFLPFVNGEDLKWVEAVRHGGIPLQLHSIPEPYFRKRNYVSYEMYEDQGEKELQRMVERGVLEGPLHYRPWVVNPMGGVWQPEKGKWRTIHDLTASGVNGAAIPSTCKYDMLEEVIKLQTTDCWMFGWDLKDAFFNQGRLQEHSDYMGTYSTSTGEFYRHRYSTFGGTDGPQNQQTFSTILSKILNEVGPK